MGIAKGAYSLLCELKKDFPDLFKGRCVQFGRQTVHLSHDKARKINKFFGLKGADAIVQSQPFDDEMLFRSLGFSQVDSIDANNYENASIIHDLNSPCPDNIKGQFDLVFDGGTLEHVFNLPQGLKTTADLLAEGGVAIHLSPSSNHVDHGFYMFSPTLYYDYYHANGFRIIRSYIFEYSRMHHIKPWIIYEYSPGSVDHLSFGGWTGDKMLAIWFVAQKLKDSSHQIIPQQGSYRRLWRNVEEGQHSGAVYSQPSKLADSTLAERLKSFVKSRTILYSALHPIVSMTRRMHFYLRIGLRNYLRIGLRKPRVIAKY